MNNDEYDTETLAVRAGNVRSQGIDWVSTYRTDFSNGSSLMSTLSATYNKNKVTGVRPNPPVLDNLGVLFVRLNRSAIKGLLADSSPRSKVIWTETYNVGAWSFTGTATRFGRITSYGSTSYLNDIIYPHKWLIDLAASYKVNRWTFTLGGNNVLNTYPDKQNTAFGQNEHGILRYWQDSPFGFEGSYVYGKVRYSW